jgi:ABC-type Fe3+ transport system permease subunit
MEENRIQDFLVKLQSLDEPTKRKVLIGSTIVIMIVVLFVWVAYFNSIVLPSATQTDQGAVTSTAQTAPTTTTGPGFWKGIENGFSQFGKGVAAGFEGIGVMFHGGHETIGPSH